MGNISQFYPGFNEGHKVPLKNIEGGGFLTLGNIYYVDSVTGSDSANNGSTPQNALATIDAAIGFCTASKGDTIVVRQHHAETVTSAITADVAGIRIVGLGEGNQRPTITGNGTIDAINVTAASVVIENLRFAAPSTDAQTADINIAGAGCTIRNTYHVGSQTSKNKTDVITIATGGDDLLIEGIKIYNVTVDVVDGIHIEAAVANLEVRHSFVCGAFSAGAIKDAATATLAYIHHNTFKNTKAATSVVDFGTGNSTGVFSDNRVSGRHTTIATNIVEGTGMDFFETYVVEEAALNGILGPGVDAD